MAGYTVHVIQEGYCNPNQDGSCRADCSITLIKGKFNILVDTGGPKDSHVIVKGLAKYGLDVKDVSHVVGTHGHLDHIGNLNLFPDATFIVSHDIYKDDLFINHDLDKTSYKIDDQVEVMSTPGHTGRDVSVVVRDTSQGTVVVAGDLFECEADLTDDSLWRDVSENPDIQEKNRRLVLEMADYIIPGHGPEFKVTKTTGLSAQN